MKKLLPSLPSLVELQVLHTSGYCNVCNVATQHDMTKCFSCDTRLCLNHDHGIFTVIPPVSEGVLSYVCVECRRNLALNSKSKVTFLLNVKKS